MKILYALIFNFIIQNQFKRDVLKRISTIKGFVQGALRKKQLIVSFVKHFTENDERLCTGSSMKEQTNSFFRRALYKENNENIISVFSVLYF